MLVYCYKYTSTLTSTLFTIMEIKNDFIGVRIDPPA